MTKKYVWIMLICCLLPILGIALIFLFNIPVGTFLWVALLLLCPLSHLWMMKTMRHEHGVHEYGVHGPGANVDESGLTHGHQ